MLAHEQLRFISEMRSVFALAKFRRVEQIRHGTSASGSALEDETLISLLHITPKKHPLLIKRIGTTRLDHAPGRANCFSVVKIAKVDLDTP